MVVDGPWRLAAMKTFAKFQFSRKNHLNNYSVLSVARGMLCTWKCLIGKSKQNIFYEFHETKKSILINALGLTFLFLLLHAAFTSSIPSPTRCLRRPCIFRSEQWTRAGLSFLRRIVAKLQRSATLSNLHHFLGDRKHKIRFEIISNWLSSAIVRTLNILKNCRN